MKSPQPSSDTDYTIIGRVGSPYGIKGWLHIESFTQIADNILQHRKWQLQANPYTKSQLKAAREIQVIQIKAQQKHFVAQLEGINDRDQAKMLGNSMIAIPTSKLPELTENEYYWHQLIGLTVHTTSGLMLGIIQDLLNTGANDIIIIEGAQRHLLPYIDNVVKQVDLKQKTMMVDWEIDPDD